MSSQVWATRISSSKAFSETFRNVPRCSLMREIREGNDNCGVSVLGQALRDMDSGLAMTLSGLRYEKYQIVSNIYCNIKVVVGITVCAR